MSALRFNLLGRPTVTLDSRTLRFPTQKALALLVYLAVEPGPHSREKLIALLWPESAPAAGQASLRNALARAKAALGAAADDVLWVEPAALSLRPGADISLDVHQLDHAVKTQRPAAFLEGFSLPDAPAFDEWAAGQRAYWHRQVSAAFGRLAAGQAAAGDWSASLATAQRWMDHDPLDEAALRALMQAHFARGDREAALRAYDAGRARLQVELGVGPTPETAALAETLRRTRVPRGTGPAAVAPLELPFVGRGAAHAELVAAYAAAASGKAQTVVIEGEAGIGKTRLVHEFLTWATTQSADVVRGRAFEAGGRLPYQPMVEALRERVDQENAPDDLLADVWLAELSRLLPELRDRYPDLPAPIADETLAPARLLEAVARLLGALAERAPVVLVVDDLQWADAATLDLLHYLWRRWAAEHTPILCLLTVRSEALATTPALREWLTAAGREAPLRRLSLGPLNAADTQQLVMVLADPIAETGLGAWLYTETQGQPFYLHETIKTLIDHGVLMNTAGGWAVALPETGLRGLLPASVRDTILARLGRLSPNALALATSAAVLGVAADLDDLLALAEVAWPEGLDALGELLTHRILVETDAAGPYAFAHDKIRDVVYTEAGAARRRHAHQRALALLEGRAAPPAELAHHALAARLPGPVFTHSVAAGDRALAVFAVRDAISFYEQARQQGAAAEAAVEAWGHLYLQLGRAYELRGQADEAWAALRALLTLARENGNAKLEGAALNRLATLTSQSFNDPQGARELLGAALGAAERSSDPAALGETEWNLAQLNYYLNDPAAVLAHGGHALELGRSLGDADLTARSLNVLAYAHMQRGTWAQTGALATEAQALFAAAGNRAMEVDSLCLVARAEAYVGRAAAGVAAGRAALAISMEIDNAWGRVNSVNSLLPGLLDLGDFEEALRLSTQAVATARTQGFRQLLIYTLARHGAAQRALFQLEAAQAAQREALELVEALQLVNRPMLVEWLTSELCADCALAGAWGRALDYAQQALAQRRYDTLYSGLTRAYETAALRRGGLSEMAAVDLEQFGAQIGNNPRYRVSYLQARARLAGTLDEMMALLTEAIALAERLGLTGELWALYAAQGDVTRADSAVAALAARIEDTGLREAFVAGARRQWAARQ